MFGLAWPSWLRLLPPLLPRTPVRQRPIWPPLPLHANAVRGGVARVQCLTGGGGVVTGREEMRVDLKGDARIRVPELTADVNDVEAARDQIRRERARERVPRFRGRYR